MEELEGAKENSIPLLSLSGPLGSEGDIVGEATIFHHRFYFGFPTFVQRTYTSFPVPTCPLSIDSRRYDHRPILRILFRARFQATTQKHVIVSQWRFFVASFQRLDDSISYPSFAGGEPFDGGSDQSRIGFEDYMDAFIRA